VPVQKRKTAAKNTRKREFTVRSAQSSKLFSQSVSLNDASISLGFHLRFKFDKH
jgi:hypothetical protein